MKRILVVENDPHWLELIIPVLQSVPDCQVETARLYDEALDLIKDARYDAAIVDLNLIDAPDHPGDDLLGGVILTYLYEHSRSTRRIALTGWPPGVVGKEVLELYHVEAILLKQHMRLSELRELVMNILPVTQPGAGEPGAGARGSELRDEFQKWRAERESWLEQQMSEEWRAQSSGRIEAARGSGDPEDQLAVLVRRKDAFTRGCARVEEMLANMASAGDIAAAARAFEELKSNFDGAR